MFVRNRTKRPSIAPARKASTQRSFSRCHSPHVAINLSAARCPGIGCTVHRIRAIASEPRSIRLLSQEKPDSLIMIKKPSGHIRLTSHPMQGQGPPYPIAWGAPSARGARPVIGSATARDHRNVIGAHGGAYSIYRALAVSSGSWIRCARPDLKDTHPVIEIGPHAQWWPGIDRLAGSLGPSRRRGLPRPKSTAAWTSGRPSRSPGAPDPARASRCASRSGVSRRTA